jgi:hypothetical protein
MRPLALALTITAFALAACGGEDGDATADGGAGGDSILIKTNVEIHIPEGGPQPGKPISEGEVLGGSSLGDSPFCPGGTFSDLHSDDPAIGLVDRTFDCADGSLRIGFTPGAPQGRTQSGGWKVVSGGGAFEGLQGGGQMEVKYERGTDGSGGRETFTGSVTR